MGGNDVTFRCSKIHHLHIVEVDFWGPNKRTASINMNGIVPEKREPIEQVLATVDVLAEGEREQGERGNFSNLVSQLSAFEVLRLT